MNMENKNTCDSGSCASCAVGMCSSGKCGCCGHNHHRGLKMLAKVILFIFFICFALKVGEVKGMVESSRMYRSEGSQFHGQMMMPGSGWNNAQPMMNGAAGGSESAPAATPSK